MPNTQEPSAWFTDYGLPVEKSARVFAFPFSGAGTIIYQPLAKQFEHKDIAFLGVLLPGRERRYREALMVDLKQLVTALVDEIIPKTDKPFVFFGHSLGALIAYECCRELRRRKAPLPQQLYISAFRSPSMPNPNPELHKLNDAQLIQRIREYGGTPESILSSPELMALFTPILRADFTLFETYTYQHEAPLNCPITTLSGSNDSIVKPEYMLGWKSQSTLPIKRHLLSGDHFFLDKHKQFIIEELTNAFQ